MWRSDDPETSDIGGAYAHIAADLATRGWSLCTDFLPPEQVGALHAECAALWRAGAFRPAAIGRGETRQVRPEVRSDRVLWLDPAAPGPAQRPYFEALQRLRSAINSRLFLGLFDFEGHLAVYPPGAFYRRHRDRFPGTEARMVTCVFYLNPSWRAGDGGQLRLHPPTGGPIDVLPRAGTLACFLTADFPHEVLTARHPRMSLTGWLRRRDTALP